MPRAGDGSITATSLVLATPAIGAFPGMTPLQDTLRSILASKAQELFVDYGVTCNELADEAASSSARQLCGILGFTGDKLCGSVVISASEDAVAASNPIRDGATRAWVAELTNQIVGRFKNGLFRVGVEVAMSIPVVLSAAQITPMPHTHLAPVRLAVAEGHVTLWLEIEAQPDLELSEPTEDSSIAPEGEAFMF